MSRRHWQTPLSRERLLESAIYYAENGIVVTRSQSELTTEKFAELKDQPNFAETFMPNGQAPAEGDILKLPALGATLKRLAAEGFDSFYNGKLADDDRRRSRQGRRRRSPPPICSAISASERPPLSTRVRGAQLFNMAPPTQGLSSLMILAMFDRLGVTQAEGFDHIHGLVEATKQAFIVRDEHVGDPDHMTVDPAAFLDDAKLDELARHIDRKRALPWPHVAQARRHHLARRHRRPGPLGVASSSRSISNSAPACVLPETGICWQNRGASFRLAESGWNALKPDRKPFHTLNPAMAIFDDGRRMVYGTMGGEGQPQTQAAVFSRYGMFGMPLQQAVTAPRWLLGKTWGDDSVTLKLEDRFEPALIEQLRAAGHVVEVLGSYSSTMGHAGAIVLHANGVLEGATDPRSDGAVAAW